MNANPDHNVNGPDPEDALLRSVVRSAAGPDGRHPIAVPTALAPSSADPASPGDADTESAADAERLSLFLDGAFHDHLRKDESMTEPAVSAAAGEPRRPIVRLRVLAASLLTAATITVCAVLVAVMAISEPDDASANAAGDNERNTNEATDGPLQISLSMPAIWRLPIDSEKPINDASVQFRISLFNPGDDPVPLPVRDGALTLGLLMSNDETLSDRALELPITCVAEGRIPATLGSGQSVRADATIGLHWSEYGAVSISSSACNWRLEGLRADHLFSFIRVRAGDTAVDIRTEVRLFETEVSPCALHSSLRRTLGREMPGIAAWLEYHPVLPMPTGTSTGQFEWALCLHNRGDTAFSATIKEQPSLRFWRGQESRAYDAGLPAELAIQPGQTWRHKLPSIGCKLLFDGSATLTVPGGLDGSGRRSLEPGPRSLEPGDEVGVRLTQEFHLPESVVGDAPEGASLTMYCEVTATFEIAE